MENTSQKCSSEEHKEIDAIYFCQECKIYLCNKCEKFHSMLFKKHNLSSLNKGIKEIFSGLCLIANHKNKLEYFCKNHNELCCTNCITKIKSKGNGQHSECNICDIEEIIEEKKNNLEKNIKSLEKLSDKINSSINELKEIIEKINEKSEEIKIKIQKTFTEIRNELNKREDELLLKVDNYFANHFFNEDKNILEEKDKLPNKIRLYLDKGKEAQKDWNKKENKISLINDCINIEKTVENINKINQTLEKYKLEKISIDFVSDQNGILKSIKNYGKVILDKMDSIKYNDFNIQIDDFDPKNLRYNKIITDKCGYGGNYYVYDGICFFISKENDYILGYIDSNSGSKSIIFYDINKENETKKINNAHKREIHIIIYYDYSLFDMILSSSMDDDVKIWNYSDCSNILIISNIFKEYNGVFSSCIIFNKNVFDIFCVGNNNYIKVIDCNGNVYKNIGDNNKSRRYIDSCEINDKKYLISGGNKGITVFNYPSLIQYNCFFDKNQGNYHNYAKIMKSNDKYFDRYWLL